MVRKESPVERLGGLAVLHRLGTDAERAEDPGVDPQRLEHREAVVGGENDLHLRIALPTIKINGVWIAPQAVQQALSSS